MYKERKISDHDLFRKQSSDEDEEIEQPDKK